MRRLIPVTGIRVSVGLLLLRLAVGASFLIHGAPKLAHPTSWGDTGPLPALPTWLQLIICLAENLGGLAIVLGLATPLFACLLACDMFVVAFIVKMGRFTLRRAPGEQLRERGLSFCECADPVDLRSGPLLD
jgi:uncharacterized membrane protein YphA (DoxX/SURF4 family)